MKNKYYQEIAITILLVSLLVFFVNPLNFWMPNQMELLIVCGALIVYVLFTTFLWKERSRDEREEEHRLRAGHIAYIVGSVILLIGIVAQHVQMVMIDPWLVYALAAMTVSKVIARIWSEEKR